MKVTFAMRAASALSAMRVAREKRRNTRMLHEFADWQLRDMGLTPPHTRPVLHDGTGTFTR